MMRRSTVVLAALAVMATAAALTVAPSQAQEPRAGRYAMQPTDGGVLRLDTETGAVSLCSRKADQWACEPVGDSSASEREEIVRLKRENADLKATVKHLEDMLGMPPDKDSGQRKAEAPGLNLPTEKQIDGAIDYVERMYKKLRDKLKQLESSAPPEKGTPL